MFFKRILTYLNPMTMFRRGSDNFNLRAMHGINRISIFVFLFCVVVMIYKWLG